MDTLVPVSEHAYHMGGSQIWLEPGEQFTLDEMIKAICVSSANDAAVAVAEAGGRQRAGLCAKHERPCSRAGHDEHGLSQCLRAGHRRGIFPPPTMLPS